MNTVYLSLQRWHRGLTALADRWAQSSWMKTTEFPVVAITAPILVVLAALLGSALGLPQPLSQGLATILGLVLVSPYMLRVMLSSTPTETDDTPCTSPMNHAEDVLNFFADQDYEGWSGLMANLTSDELEFLSELLGAYLEDNDDLNHTEFGFAKGLLDKIDEALA